MEEKKPISLWMKVGWVLLITMILLAIFGPEPKKDKEHPATKELVNAKPYEIVKDDAGHPRKLAIAIVSPDAITAEQRMETVTRAAKELSEQRQRPVVAVHLVYDSVVAGRGGVLAQATYFADGCGFGGLPDQCDGKHWDNAEVNDFQVTAAQLASSKTWYELRPQFVDENGYLPREKEDKLIAAVAKKLKIKPDDVNLPVPTGNRPFDPSSLGV